MAEIQDSTLTTEFARRARREEQFRRLREEQESRRKEEQDARAEAGDFAEAAIAASAAQQRAEFSAQLTLYETATVQALLENERQQKIARERLQDTLDRAHVLPDGRRVFRTEDGLEVYDEDGDRLSPDEVDPNAISDERPTWETFFRHDSDLKQLDDERQELIDYQHKLDEARDRLDDDDLTKDKLDDLAGELEGMMPASVRREIQGNEQAPEQPAASTERPESKATLSDQLPSGPGLPSPGT